MGLNDIPDVALSESCKNLQAASGSKVPILFKGCISESVSLPDVVFFPDSKQNLFPACSGKITRDFEFVGIDNSTIAIIEDVPCQDSTLSQKVSDHQQHNLSRDGSYFSVHTYMMHESELEFVMSDLKAKRIFPDDLNLRERPAILTYFLHAGATAVYYLHAHMDSFYSFNLMEPKIWELINPKYTDQFTYAWSGNALMMLKENSAAPRVIIKQERGDILYIPPWWVHQTRLSEDNHNAGFNIHLISEGSFFGSAVQLAQSLGWSQFFYRNAF